VSPLLHFSADFSVASLSHLQSPFQRYLLEGEPAIEQAIAATAQVPATTRLAIYGEGYRLRLIEALQATFPVLAELLGEGDFATLATRYVERHVSTFFSIRYYGDLLAEFLARDEHYRGAPLLTELARWEWEMAAVFDAADSAPLEIEAFAALPPERWAELRFDWTPSVRVLVLEWNVPALWKAVTEGAQRPEPVLSAAPVDWLLWRRDLQLYFRSLSSEEAASLRTVLDGGSFGELCIKLCDGLDEHEASARAAGFLRGWVQSGLIAGMHLPPLPPAAGGESDES